MPRKKKEEEAKYPDDMDLIRGSTKLQHACRAGDLEEVKRLCEEEEVFLDYINNMGNTALDIATKKQHTEIVKFLSTLK